MRFAVLGSGSRGNALVVESGNSRLLVDVGFGPGEMARRLARLGLSPADIRHVLLTHEHSDHMGGALACARRFGWRLFLTHGSSVGFGEGKLHGHASIIGSHQSFVLDDFSVQPFPVPHDAREPVHFVFSDGNSRLGMLTDAGHVTPHMVASLQGCHALVLECNHDMELLAQSNYPPMLKQRIAGAWGHLDNAAAASLLRQVLHADLRQVVAVHLSEQNNRPQLACAALGEVLGCSTTTIGVASQNEGFGWCPV